MVKVLLNRPFRTPRGRFKPDPDGHAVDISKKIIDLYGLPSDAEVVDPDYVPPSQREEGGIDSGSLTPDEINALVEKRVQERLKEEADKAVEKSPRRRNRSQPEDEEPEDEEPEDEDDILDQSVDTIKDALGAMDEDELNDLMAREKAGKTRKSLISAIEEELKALED